MCVSKLLLHKIEKLRQEMTTIALKKGFASEESIRLSQELDRLLNIYQQRQKKEFQRPANHNYYNI